MSNMAESTKLARPKFATRQIRLVGIDQRDLAIALIRNIPIDPVTPLEIRIGESTKVRGLDANSRMWAGPLRDLAEQGWVDGRQFSAEVWHEHLKQLYLYEDDDLDLSEMVKDGYRKWDFSPSGDRILVGSTTQLTKRGFANYLEQVCAYAANLGVQLSDAPGRDS